MPSSEPTYEHRPRPFSNPLEMVLSGPELRAQRGSRKETYRLAEVEEMRLSYAPKNTQRLGFSCVLRLRDRRTLTFTNLDWRSLVENARQDAPYAAFVSALATRIAQANPRAILLAGVPGWRHGLYSLGAVVMGVAMLGVALALAWRQSWALTAFALGLLVWLGFFAREYLSRNRPMIFTPGAIPPGVLPPAG